MRANPFIGPDKLFGKSIQRKNDNGIPLPIILNGFGIAAFRFALEGILCQIIPHPGFNLFKALGVLHHFGGRIRSLFKKLRLHKMAAPEKLRLFFFGAAYKQEGRQKYKQQAQG